MFGSAAVSESVNSLLNTAYFTSSMIAILLKSYGGESNGEIVGTALFRISLFTFLIVSYLHFATLVQYPFAIGKSSDAFQRVQEPLQLAHQGNP